MATALFPLWRKRARRLRRQRIIREVGRTLPVETLDPGASFRAGWEWDLDVNRMPLL